MADTPPEPEPPPIIVVLPDGQEFSGGMSRCWGWVLVSMQLSSWVSERIDRNRCGAIADSGDAK